MKAGVTRVASNKMINKSTDPRPGSLAERVLCVALSKWQQDFVGTSAREISQSLGIRHDRVVRAAKRLEALGKVTLQPTQLSTVSVRLTKKGVHFGTGPLRDTVMVFPSPVALKRDAERVSHQVGPYTSALQHGESQIRQRFFRRAVLKEYIDQQDRFTVREDIAGGSVSRTDAYYLSLPEHERATKDAIDVRYGRVRLCDGGEAIGAILHDLHELPRSDQIRWSSYEVSIDQIDHHDQNWRNHVKRQFLAEWVDSNDPIKTILSVIRHLVEQFGLYTKVVDNPDLHYLTHNNLKAYIVAHTELEKVVIAPLNARRIEEILGRVDKTAVMPRDKSGRILTVNGLQILIGTLSKEMVPVVMEPIRNCQRTRNKTHVVDEKALEVEDYPARFVSDCRQMARALTLMRELLSGAMPASSCG